MRLGLFLFGLLNGVSAALFALRLGAGIDTAALLYSLASTLSVLSAAVFLARYSRRSPRARRPRLQYALARSGAPPPSPRARLPGQAPGPAPAPDWSAAA